MNDFSQHYYQAILAENGALECRPVTLLDEMHTRFDSFNNVVPPERYPVIMSSFAFSLARYAVQCELLGCPQWHVKWLLKEAVNAWRAHFNMERQPNQSVTFEFLGEKRCAIAPTKTHFTSFNKWMEALCLAELVGDSAARSDLLAYPVENFLNVGSVNTVKTDIDFSELFKCFFSRETDITRKSEIFNRCNALVQPGVITEIDGDFVETYAWFMNIPLFQLISYHWQVQEESLEEITQAAMQANYEYFSEIAPQPGAERGRDSVDLFNPFALLHLQILAILRVIYLESGEMVNIHSPFLPQWLIRGEGPSLDELNQTMPTFDLTMFNQ